MTRFVPQAFGIAIALTPLAATARDWWLLNAGDGQCHKLPYATPGTGVTFTSPAQVYQWLKGMGEFPEVITVPDPRLGDEVLVGMQSTLNHAMTFVFLGTKAKCEAERQSAIDAGQMPDLGKIR